MNVLRYLSFILVLFVATLLYTSIASPAALSEAFGAALRLIGGEGYVVVENSPSLHPTNELTILT